MPPPIDELVAVGSGPNPGTKVPILDLSLLGQVLSIVVIDLVLSGDNAMVIGMASRGLRPENRKKAILFGGLGAVLLRVVFTAMAAFLLDIPLLEAAGGILLIWISFKLLRPVDHHQTINETESLWAAIKTIILADVVMSLDNILAVGGAAHGSIELLVFGLALSIPILLLGSNLVAKVMSRYPVLVYFGVVVLIHTAVVMFFSDEKVKEHIYDASTLEIIAVTVVVSVLEILLSLKMTGQSLSRQSLTSNHPKAETLNSPPN